MTWNCQMGFDKKRSVFDTLSPDVAVIQEVSKAADIFSESGVSALWATPGKSDSKGIAVIGLNGWTVEPLAAPTELPWVLPCSIKRPDGSRWADVLAIWTHKSQGDGRPHYAEQFHATTEVWADVLRSNRTLMVGDLNASIQGPSREGQEESLRRATSLGLVSAYHSSNNVDHGAEPDMTLKWIGPGKKPYFYHCDFVFVPEAMTAGMNAFVHPIFALFSEHVSDHQPVVVDFAS